ncbi:hypothetical protein RYX36_032834 [Vicia faba]
MLRSVTTIKSKLQTQCKNIRYRFHATHVPPSPQTSTSATTPNANQEERGDTQQPASHQRNPAESSANQAGARRPDASIAGESGIRIVPIRTMVATVPGPLGRPSESSATSTGLYHPVIGRFQRVTTGHANSEQGSQSASQDRAAQHSTPAPTSTVEDDKEQLPETCHPSLEGFIRFLVDNQHVFATLERIIDDSDDVSYAYLRKTGLERSEGILKDLEWLKEEGVEIPNPSSRGITYAKYLEELAETSAPLFLSHFYNIHFSHITGGQVITKQVSERLLEGKELEFCKWEASIGKTSG